MLVPSAVVIVGRDDGGLASWREKCKSEQAGLSSYLRQSQGWDEPLLWAWGGQGGDGQQEVCDETAWPSGIFRRF